MLRPHDEPEYLAALRLTCERPSAASLPPAYGVGDPLAGLSFEAEPTPPLPTHHPLLRYLRREILPTAFCVGCGGGIVLNAFAHAVEELGLDPREMVCVTGIGCSSWIPSPYFLCDTLHTTHGRAIAFATGVKIVRPDRQVVVIAGDGDLAGIGGNHLIHAARRNVDLTVFLVNNLIYGMTGGQVSPTTPHGIRTTTTPYQNLEHAMRIADVVAAAGASYVARWTTYHAFQLVEAMQVAMRTVGFSLVEIVSQCPVSYGKTTGLTDPVAMLRHLRDASIAVDEARAMTEEELEERFVVGTLASRSRAELGEGLRRLNRERRAALEAELGLAGGEDGPAAEETP